MKEITAKDVAEYIIHSDIPRLEDNLYYVHVNAVGDFVDTFVEGATFTSPVDDISEWENDDSPVRFYEEYENTENKDFMSVCEDLAYKINEYLEKMEEQKRFVLIDQRDGDMFNEVFPEGVTMEEAIKKADSEWNRLSAYDKKHREMFVLIKTFLIWDDSPILDAAEEIKDYLRKMYTADKETGTFIDKVTSVQEGLYLIEKYEEFDKANGTYTPDFYDIVDENHCSITERM